MGGWPTTAFLTPGGEVMAGMTYIPPDQMRDVLNQVSTYYKDNKDYGRAEDRGDRSRTASARRRRLTTARRRALATRSCATCCTAAQDAYDPVFGGFGNEPKFPHTDAIDLLLHAYLRDGDRDALHMARKTLEQMCKGGTYDQEWGGFYRYSTKRDWSVPHYEKMLEDNALLLRNAAQALPHHARDAEHRRIHRLHDCVPGRVAERPGDGRVLRLAGRRRGVLPAADGRAEAARGAVRRQDGVHELERDGDQRVPRGVVDAGAAGAAGARR